MTDDVDQDDADDVECCDRAGPETRFCPRCGTDLWERDRREGGSA